MFSLIITVVSITLVAALALATIYYGGSSFREGQATAKAAGLMTQGQQILGALETYKVQQGSYPNSLAELAPEYLKTLPVPSVAGLGGAVGGGIGAAFALDSTWTMPTPQVPVIEVADPVALDVCRKLNLKTYGTAGVLKRAYSSYKAQCFGNHDAALKVVLTAKGEALAAGLPGVAVAAGKGPEASDKTNLAWFLAPGAEREVSTATGDVLVDFATAKQSNYYRGSSITSFTLTNPSKAKKTALTFINLSGISTLRPGTPGKPTYSQTDRTNAVNLTRDWNSSPGPVALDLSNNPGLVALNNLFYSGLVALDVTGATALQALVVPGNQLTTLDVSSNTALQRLYVGGNQLTSLDVSSNTALQYLYVDGNPLPTLDLSSNTALKELNVGATQRTAIDVSALTALEYLSVRDNPLTTLDVSANTALQYLYAYKSQLTSLNVAGATALKYLSVYNNQLTSLDLSNSKLTSLTADNNQLTALNVTGSTVSSIAVNNNQLTALDLSSNTALLDFSANNNKLTALNVTSATALQALSVVNCQVPHDS